LENSGTYPQVDNRLLWYNTGDMKKKKALIVIILIVGGLICFGGVFLAKGIDFPYSFSNLFNTEDITIENLEDIYQGNVSELEKILGSDNEGNITEMLLNELISPTGELRNQDLTQADIERLANEIFKKQSLNSVVLEIPEVDLNLSEDSSKRAVETYLISIIYILNKNAPLKGYKLEATLEGDMSFVDEFAKNLASGDERKIAEVAKDFQKIYLELQELEVPPPALEIHKRALEISLGMTGFLEELKFIKTDPMRVLLAMRGLEQIRIKAQELGEGLEGLMEEYDIILP